MLKSLHCGGIQKHLDKILDFSPSPWWTILLNSTYSVIWKLYQPPSRPLLIHIVFEWPLVAKIYHAVCNRIPIFMAGRGGFKLETKIGAIQVIPCLHWRPLLFYYFTCQHAIKPNFEPPFLFQQEALHIFLHLFCFRVPGTSGRSTCEATISVKMYGSNRFWFFVLNYALNAILGVQFDIFPKTTFHS